jgi:hypothetical protein
MKGKLYWIGGCTSLALLCAMVVVLSFNQWPVSIEQLEKVTPGMAATEVVALIGAPAWISDDGQEWCYSRLLSWPLVYVYFDGDQKVVRVGQDY